MATATDSKQFSIKWIKGYGVLNGKSELHAQSWFDEDMGFTQEMIEQIVSLNVGDVATLGEMFGTVKVTRIA